MRTLKPSEAGHEIGGYIAIQLSQRWVPNFTLRAPPLQPNWVDAIKVRLVWKGGRNSQQFLPSPVNLQTAHLPLSSLAQLVRTCRRTNIQTPNIEQILTHARICQVLANSLHLLFSQVLIKIPALPFTNYICLPVREYLA